MNNLYRASSLHRYRHCGGAPAAEADLPNEPEKSWTEDGTKVHDALLDDAKVKDLPDELAEIVDNMAMAAEYAVDKILPASPGIERGQLIRERKEPFYVYPNCWVTAHPFISGHPDYILFGTIYDKKIAIILDFKSGYLEVPAPEVNDQLRAYAVAVWQENPDLEEVYAGIIPRFGIHTPVCYTVADLRLALLDLWDLHQATLDANAPRTPSVEACRYCKARATSRCPETLFPPKALVEPKPLIDLTPEEKGKLLVTCQIVTGNIKKLKERLQAELVKNAEAVSGWEIVSGDIRNSIPDASACWQVVSDLLIEDEFQRCLTVGQTKLKNALKEVLRDKDGLKGKSADARIKAILYPVTVAKQGEDKLAQKES